MSTKRISLSVMILITIVVTFGFSQSHILAQGPTPTPAASSTPPAASNELFASAGPNGQYVISSNKTGQYCLYPMDENGKMGPLIFCSQKKQNLFPSWSPDGKNIVFAACDMGQGIANCELWAVSPDGTNPRQLAVGYMIVGTSRFTWNANGEPIFSAGNLKNPAEDLYSINSATGSNTQQITKNTMETDEDPVFANGKLYTACKKSQGPPGICIVNADGTTTLLYQIAGLATYLPDVCRVDGRLAFQTEDANGTSAIVYQNKLGGLSSFSGMLGPTWTPDCTHIIFTKPDDTGHFKLWSMKVDSDDVPVLLTGSAAVSSFQGLVPPTKTPTPQ